MDDFNEFYIDAPKWIAEIKVNAMLPDSSAVALAEHILDLALGIIKVILGSNHQGDKVKRVNDYSQPKQHFSISNNNKFNWSISKNFGAISLDDWYELIFRKHGNILEIYNKTIVKMQDREPLLLLEEKLVNAITCYNQAFIEKSDGLKVVKYVTALEFLVSAKDYSGSTRYVPKRTAMMIAGSWGLSEIEAQKHCDDIKNIYSIRSDIVHGKVSQSDKKVTAVLSNAHDICRKAIIASILFYDFLGFNDFPTHAQFKEKLHELWGT